MQGCRHQLEERRRRGERRRRQVEHYRLEVRCQQVWESRQRELVRLM